MNKYQRFLSEIRGEMRVKKIKQQDMAKEIGVSGTSLSLFLNGNTTSIEMIEKVMKYLDDYKMEEH